MFLVVISLILLATQLANSAAVLPRQAGETVVTVTQVVTVPVATPTKTSFYTVFETVTASQSALSAGLLPVTQISNGQLQVPPPATIQSVQSVNSNSKSIVDSPTIVVSASRVGFSGIHYSASSIVTPSSLPFPKYTWKPSTQSSNRSYCKASKATLAPSIPMASNSTASKPATGTPAASKPATSNSASSKPAANNPLAYSRLTLSHGSSLGSAMLPPSSAPVKPPVSTQSSDFFTILYPSNTNPAASMASSSKQPTSPKPTPAHSSSSSHSTAIVVIPVTGSALAELKSKINIPAASVTAHHPRDFRRADKSDAVNPLLSKLFTNGPQIVPTINLQPVTIVSTKPPSTIFECGLPIATSPGSVVTYLSTPSGHVEHPPTAPAKVSYTFSLGPTTSSTPPPPPPPKSTPPPPPPPPPPSSSKYVPPRTLTHIVGERRAEPSPAVGAFTGLHYSAEPIITPSANHKNAERVREGLVVDENPSPSIPVVTRYALASPPASEACIADVSTQNSAHSASLKPTSSAKLASSHAPSSKSAASHTPSSMSVSSHAPSSKKPTPTPASSSAKPSNIITWSTKQSDAPQPTPTMEPTSTKAPWCPYPGQKCHVPSQKPEPTETKSKKWCPYPGQNC